MNTMIDKLVVTPISWLLAIPIVLLDRLLSPDLTELPHRDSRTLPQRTVERCAPSR
jgi:hypothetical protein